jgi:AcrR family transcriptional regulator
MARRSDHSPEALKNMAILAGYNIIAAQGFEQFSARKVAAEIGYTVGTIYNIFGTHDALLLHINAHTLDVWYAALEDRIASCPHPLTIDDIARFYIAYSTEHYHEWLALFEHRLGDNAPLPEWYMPKMTRFFDVVEAVVLPYVAHNHESAHRAARVLWAGIHGICILSHSKKLDLVASESAYELAASFVENYLRGLQCE